MIFDIKTIYFIMGIIFLALALSTVSYAISRKTFPGFNKLTIGFVFSAIGSILTGLAKIAPPIISIILSNIFHFVAISLFYIGIKLFIKEESNYYLQSAIVIILSCIIMPIFTYIYPYTNIRIAIYSFTLGTYLLLCVILLLKKNEYKIPKLNTLFAFSLISIVIVIYFRGVFHLFFSDHVKTILDTGEIHAVMLLIIIFLSIIIITSIFHLNASWLEIQLSKEHVKLLKIQKETKIFAKAISETYTPIIITDSSGNIKYINPSYTRLTGYSPVEVIGQNPRIVKSGVHDNTFYEKLWNSINKGDKWTNEICNKDKNDKLFWVMATISPIFDESGTITNFVAVYNDISELKKMEQLKENVDAIIQHDLKQPITAILGMKELLKLEFELNNEQKNILDLIEDSGKRMHDMIELSMDIFKMEKGAYEYIPDYVDLIDIITRNVDYAKFRNKKVGVKFTVMLNSKLIEKDYQLFIDSDKKLLDSIFSNLLMNAIEASPPNEEILIDIKSNETVSVEIHNKGAVHPDIRDSFFDKYVTYGKRKGTGLGTYSAKLLANTMGYDIKMETSDDENKTVIFINIPKIHSKET